MKPLSLLAVASVAFALSLSLSGCDEKKPDSAPLAAPNGQPAAIKTADPAPARPATVVALSDDDVAVKADFEEEAQKSITAANYKAELDSIDNELK